MSKKAPINTRWESESALCSDFIEFASGKGWRCYPETGGFDILCVATESVRNNARPGTQLGIQAKLRANLEVVAQSLPSKWMRQGPAHYGILVPKSTEALRDVAKRLDLMVFSSSSQGRFARKGYDKLLEPIVKWPRAGAHHTEPAWVPPLHVEGLQAGVASPSAQSPWKFAAVTLCLRALERGFVTSRDFAELKLSMTVWRAKSWIVAGEPVTINGKRYTTYALNLGAKPPHLLYPEFAQAVFLELMAAK